MFVKELLSTATGSRKLLPVIYMEPGILFVHASGKWSGSPPILHLLKYKSNGFGISTSDYTVVRGESDLEFIDENVQVIFEKRKSLICTGKDAF